MNNKYPTYRGEHRPFSVALDTTPDGIKFQIKNFCGQDITVKPRFMLCDVKDFVGRKMTNIGISLTRETADGKEPFAVLTKSFGEFIGAKNCAYIDTNNCLLADIFLQLGIAQDVDFSIKSGFFTYPLWEFKEDFLCQIGGEEYEKYSQAYDDYMRGDCHEPIETDDETDGCPIDNPI